MALYTAGTHLLRKNSGAQAMLVALGSGTVVFEVQVEDDNWVTDNTVESDGKIKIDTQDASIRMVITGDSKVKWN